MIVNMPNKEGVTLATQGKYCAENIEVVPSFPVSNTFAEFVSGTKNVITAEDLEGATAIRDNAFYASTITNIDIPDSVTYIGTDAFYQNIFLKKVVMPDSVTKVGTLIFFGCKSLTTARLSDNITSSIEGIFYNCSNLKAANIPQKVTQIARRAFRGCSSLESIIIPSGVISMSTEVFLDCSALKKVVCLAETPPTIAANTFSGVPTDCIFEVLADSVEAYKAETNWSVRADYIVAKPE